MQLLKIILLCAGILLAPAAGVCFWLSYLLEHSSSATREVRARLVERSHRKNVKIYGKTYRGTLPRQVYFLKDLCKGVYEYTVDGKTYRIKENHYGPPAEQLLMLTVIYLRRCPKIACPESSMPKTMVFAILLTAWAVLSILTAFAL